MNDIYMHVDDKVIYIVENIPGPADECEEFRDLMYNFNSQLTDHCKCNQKCVESTCSCLQKCGGLNYLSVDNNSKFILNPVKDFKTRPILECNSLCLCSDQCGNRLVQKGPNDSLIVKACDDKTKGLGLFTNNMISEGTFICEYAGEVITKSEALKRYESNKKEGRMNYIYCLNEHTSEQVSQTFVDPSHFGNIGRYINHSCDPNCQIIPVRIDTPIPKLAVFSYLDIGPGMELTFDYGSHNLKNSDFKTSESDNRTKCLCKSHNCRKFMPYDCTV